MKTAIMLALVAALSAPAMAHGKHMKKDIKLLNDSAAALESTNPDLSSKLKDLAVREEAVKETKTEESVGQDQADVQIIKDSANALRGSRPDLAKGLDRFAIKESREAKHGTKGMHENRMMPGNTPGY